jgi:hypothetical protein
MERRENASENEDEEDENPEGSQRSKLSPPPPGNNITARSEQRDKSLSPESMNAGPDKLPRWDAYIVITACLTKTIARPVPYFMNSMMTKICGMTSANFSNKSRAMRRQDKIEQEVIVPMKIFHSIKRNAAYAFLETS